MYPKIKHAALNAIQRPMNVGQIEAQGMPKGGIGISVVTIEGIPRRFRIGGHELVQALLTCDVDYPDGPAWHYVIIPGGMGPDFKVIPGDGALIERGPPRNRNTWILVDKLFEDLGEGEIDLYRLDDGSQIHAFRLLRLDERLRMGQGGE